LFGIWISWWIQCQVKNPLLMILPCNCYAWWVMPVEHWGGTCAVAKTSLCSSAESGGMLRQTSASWIGTGIYSSFRKTNDRHLETVDPEPQLIAQALQVASVQSNNRTRNLSGLEPSVSK
jgi:hypothetical protein